ncbi:MAG TPA: GMC family oxidoreductase [Polyangiaceae bacterium]|nr:GMC family oxidoreductase [Polyangiaceae bacterium]
MADAWRERIFQWPVLVASDTAVSCDVAIVGSGCGGAALAMRLAEAGKSVVILERGGYYTKDDFDQRELNMLARVDGGRGLDTSEDGSIALTYGNNVGGASVHYWADSYRLPEDRAQQWQEVFGMQGHDPATLAKHYAVIERDLHVHPAADAYVNRMNAIVRDTAQALGWHVKRVPQARRGCLASGFCMQGCAYDAKQSQLVTYVPRALAAGARLYADTDAIGISFQGRQAKTLHCQVLDRGTGQPSKTRVDVTARAIVIAAGGFNTPEVLQRVALPQELPALGQNFFCNPCPMVHARFDEDIIQWRNIPAAWGVEEFRRARYQGPERAFGRPSSSDYIEGGYLLMPNQLQPGLLAAVLPGAGAKHRELMRELPRLGGTIAWIDDIEPGSIRVEDGQRRISMPLRGGNAARIRDAWIKQAQLLIRAGARELMFGDAEDTRITRADEIEPAVAQLSLRPARNVFAAPHPGGGARMGSSERDSVVGFDHRVHGTDNLYVSDPSVFPAPPSVDPSLTIMAFSFVAADAIQSAIA